MCKVVALMPQMRYDLEPARKYGELYYLLDRPVSPFKTDQLVAALADAITKVGFDWERDYFVMAGPAILLAVAYAMLMRDHGMVRTLIYDSVRETYELRDIRLETVA